MRGHLEDVYDLCWSPDSTHLISGSVDTTAIIWDVQKGKCVISDYQQVVWLRRKINSELGMMFYPCVVSRLGVEEWWRGKFQIILPPSHFSLLRKKNTCICVLCHKITCQSILCSLPPAQLTHALKESQQYVQGVAWDPLDKYVAAISCDRHLRIYSTENHKFKCVHAVNKMSVSDQVSVS